MENNFLFRFKVEKNGKLLPSILAFETLKFQWKYLFFLESLPGILMGIKNFLKFV